VSVRPSVSGFRPNIRFLATRPRLAASLTAAAAAASVMIAAAPGASAATGNGGQVNLLSMSHLKITTDATPQPAKPAKPAKKAAPAAKKKTAAKQQDYTFYDSTTPSEIPAHEQIATYADGDYAVERSTLSDPDQVIWIDTDAHDANANALDVEPGDATPSQVAGWVQRHLAAEPGSVAIVYTMRSEWAAAKASVATLPASMQAQVRWWIADPTGYPHIVPGSQATQWYWGENYDISTAEPGF
jgi:negative regulator of sigma E activity